MCNESSTSGESSSSESREDQLHNENIETQINDAEDRLGEAEERARDNYTVRDRMLNEKESLDEEIRIGERDGQDTSDLRESRSAAVRVAGEAQQFAEKAERDAQIERDNINRLEEQLR